MCPVRINMKIFGNIGQPVVRQLRQTPSGHIQRIYIVIVQFLPPGQPHCIIGKIHIKSMYVMPYQHTVTNKLQKTSHGLFDIRGILYHLIRNPIYRSSPCRYMPSGVHQG